MEQFNVFYDLFIELGLSNDLANLSSCCALAVLLVFICALWVLLFCSIGYLIGYFIANKKYYLYCNEDFYFYTVGKSKFRLNRIYKKYLFKYKYTFCFYDKFDMFTVINQLGLMPVNAKLSEQL